MAFLESSFEVMEHSDLLQWIYNATKTGVCRFRLGAAIRRVYFRAGKIVACSSNEPHLLLGQFLIANGRISAGTLQECMRLQETSGRTLGEILVEMGKVSEVELGRLVRSKAEETIFGLFDWPQGQFRFEPDREPPRDTMKVDLDVPTVLLEGAQRFDDCARSRQVFPSFDVVLHTTDRRPDPQSLASCMGRRLYDAIDGERTLAEIILVCRTSAYHACSFLARLVEREIVHVGDARSRETRRSGRGVAIERLHSLVAQGEYDEAIELIEENDFERGGSDLVGMLIVKAEAAYLAEAYRNETPPHAVPRSLVTGPARHGLGLGSEELYLLDLLDGKWDVRSLVWIAPMRKVVTIRTLKHLLRHGLIEMTAPAPAGPNTDEGPTLNERDVDGMLNRALGATNLPREEVDANTDRR